MKGYIYICKMVYEGESYYKIGRACHLGRRELDMKVANPFFKIIAKKVSLYPEREEKKIHDHLKPYHFRGEWFKLADEQYTALFNDFHFENYPESDRFNNLKLANMRDKKSIPSIPKEGLTEYDSKKTRLKKIAEHFQYYHVFKKTKILKGGKRVYRWYYYYTDPNGKKIQKACRGCTKREEANEFILKLDAPV